MNLSFKEKFVPLIVNCSKITTIREDKYNRWKIGSKIHFCTGLRTKKYNVFKTGTVKDIIPITLFIDKNGNFNIIVAGWLLNLVSIHHLAIKDGFNDSSELCKFFFPKINQPYINGKLLKYETKIQNELKNVKYLFNGKLIYWY